MGTYDTRGGTPRHDPAFDQEAPISEEEQNVAELLELGTKMHAELRELKQTLASALGDAMTRLMPVGHVIDLDQRKGLSEWCWLVKVERGNARGARMFEVASAIGVEPDLSHVDGTKWSCEAYPLNADGKRLSGRSHGANSNRATVRIRGDILADRYTFSVEAPKADPVQRMVEVVAQAYAA